MSFVKVAETSEIPAGKMKMVKIQDKEVLIANVDGRFYAIANRCSHKGGDLSKGTLEGNIVTCPVHGSRFDVTTGKSLSGPKRFYNTSTGDVVTYELRTDGKNIVFYQRSSWGI